MFQFWRFGRFLTLTLVCTFWFASAHAKEFITSAKMARVEQVAASQAAKYGARKVLVVFDLDNTLLAPNQDLGSDQWFAWQAGLLKSERTEGRVASTFGELLDIQGVLYAVSHMHTPEKQTANTVRHIQSRGHPTITLTSRGPEFRNSTELSLRRNGLSFRDSAMRHNLPGTYFPATAAHHPGLSQIELKRFKILPARNVSYTDGIYMTAGQHKGAMLRLLLGKLDLSYPAIVFVDDKKKNCTQVQEGFASQETDLTLIHYTAEEERVEGKTSSIPVLSV